MMVGQRLDHRIARVKIIYFCMYNYICDYIIIYIYIHIGDGRTGPAS